MHVVIAQLYCRLTIFTIVSGELLAILSPTCRLVCVHCTFQGSFMGAAPTPRPGCARIQRSIFTKRPDRELGTLTEMD